MTQDTPNSIFSSAKRFFGGTMLSRISGMLRDIVMASVFGTQASVAAFFMAFRFAHLLRRIFGEGAMQTAFIPQFESLRQGNAEQAGNFFRDLFVLLTTCLSVLIFVSMIALGGILIFFDLSSGNSEILFLTVLMMPSLLFICLFGLNAALLQCEKHYFITGAAPVAFNLIWIIGVYCLRNVAAPTAMPWLAGVVIAACFCQWLMTVPAMLQILQQHGIKQSWRNICMYSADIRKLKTPLMLGILGVIASQINNALDAVFARYAETEGPAYLWYALRIQQLPLALFGIAISGALLPPLSRALKSNNFALFRNFLELALRHSIALMLPLTALFFVMGDSCVNLIYGRGGFSDLSTVGTSQCLWGYNLGLIPMTLVLILAPAYYAQGDYRTPMIASVASMLLNVILNALMIFGLGLGATSVAIATGVSAWVNFVLLFGIVQQHMGDALLKVMISNAGKIFVASVAAVMTVFAVDHIFLQGSSFWLIWQGDVPVFPRKFAEQIIRLFIQAISFCAGMLSTAWLINANDLLELVGRSKRVREEGKI